MNKSGFVIVAENGLYGLEDANGQRVVPCEYDKILDYDDDGYIRLLKGEVYSTISIKGKKSISLSKGLTHLGVFWGGTARARKGGGWGLVDVNGNAVTKFTFTQINAHRNNGYFAVDEDGIKGWLLEDGRFSPFDKQTDQGKKKSLPVFNVEKFKKGLRKYICDGYNNNPLHVFYRNTDAEFDIDECYKKGQVIRAGSFMEATEKLLRPVHKVRFIIVAARLFSIKKFLNLQCNQQLPNPFPFKENIIHRNSYFVVVDVFRYAGKTQILLVKIPHGAYVLAKKYGFNFKKLDEGSEIQGVSLKDFARIDFEYKMTASVHGHSINEEWTEAMHHPVGLDKSMKPVCMEPDTESAMFKFSYDRRKYDVTFERYYDVCCDDYDYEWKEYMYVNCD